MEAEEKKQQPNDGEITISLKRNEVFQLNLCVVARVSAAQMKFANAYCAEEQKSAESLIAYLTGLSAKLSEALKNGQE